MFCEIDQSGERKRIENRKLGVKIDESEGAGKTRIRLYNIYDIYSLRSVAIKARTKIIHKKDDQ